MQLQGGVRELIAESVGDGTLQSAERQRPRAATTTTARAVRSKQRSGRSKRVAVRPPERDRRISTSLDGCISETRVYSPRSNPAEVDWYAQEVGRMLGVPGKVTIIGQVIVHTNNYGTARK